MYLNYVKSLSFVKLWIHKYIIPEAILILHLTYFHYLAFFLSFE
jgi:hypothetical protein